MSDDRERRQAAEVRNVLRRAWAHRLCLHPDAPTGCTGKVISAHSIPRRGVLSAICGPDGHVLTFNTKYEAHGREGPWRVGWRQASTFSGFCGAHDASTFLPLDDHAFDGTPQQTFLMAYRALCLEMHDKIASLRSTAGLRSLVDTRQEPDVRSLLHEHLTAVHAGEQKGIAARRRLKARMDGDLLSSDFTRWRRIVVWCKGDLPLAVSGGFGPNRDLDGEVLQVLHDRDDPRVELLHLGTAVTTDGFAFTLVWDREERAPQGFVESLLRRPRARLPSLLVQIALAYVGNSYFAERWWTSRRPVNRQHLARLGQVANAAYANLAWVAASLGDWVVVRVSE